MTNQKYNGWANRETWLVNLHFGELMEGYANEYLIENPEMDAWELGELLDECLDEIIGDEILELSPFIADFIDLAVISWHDLAITYKKEFELNRNRIDK